MPSRAFTLMQKRHKTKTTLITSNPSFSDWGRPIPSYDEAV